MSFLSTVFARLARKSAGLRMPGVSMYGLSRSSWAQALAAQFGFFANTRIDYASEVGDLSLSSLVMAAVNWFGTAMPEAAFTVERPKNDKFELVANHPLTRLWQQPNAYYVGESYAFAIAFSWIVDGNVYFYKVRNRAGQVIELWYLPHFLVEPEYDAFDPHTFIKTYLYSVNGLDYHLPVEDVLHIRRSVDPANPRKGIGIVRPILREIYTDNEAANYSATMFRNLGLPGFIIAPTNETAQIDKDKRAELRDKFESEFKGDGRGRLLVSSKKVDIHRLSFDPDKMNADKSRRISEERWAALTGIPAIVLGFGAGLERSTYSNFEQALEQAYKGFLLPTLRQIAPQIGAQLLHEMPGEEANRVRFNVDELQILQEDRNALSKRVVEEWKADLITREDAKLLLHHAVAPDDKIYYTQFRAQLTAQSANNTSDSEEEKSLLETKSNADDEREAAAWWDAFAPDAAADLLSAEVEAEESEA